jgi:hypothetical protein
MFRLSSVFFNSRRPHSHFHIAFVIGHKHTRTNTDKTAFDIKMSVCACVRLWLF